MSKTVGETTAKDPELNTLLIGALADMDRSAWTTTVQVQGQLVLFKLQGLKLRLFLRTFKHSRRESISNQQSLPCTAPNQPGSGIHWTMPSHVLYWSECVNRGSVCHLTSKSNLLGLLVPSITTLKLLTRVDHTTTTSAHPIQEKYPNCSHDWGLLETKLQEEV